MRGRLYANNARHVSADEKDPPHPGRWTGAAAPEKRQRSGRLLIAGRTGRDVIRGGDSRADEPMSQVSHEFLMCPRARSAPQTHAVSLPSRCPATLGRTAAACLLLRQSRGMLTSPRTRIKVNFYDSRFPVPPPLPVPPLREMVSSARHIFALCNVTTFTVNEAVVETKIEFRASD